MRRQPNIQPPAPSTNEPGMLTRFFNWFKSLFSNNFTKSIKTTADKAYSALPSTSIPTAGPGESSLGNLAKSMLSLFNRTPPAAPAPAPVPWKGQPGDAWKQPRKGKGRRR